MKRKILKYVKNIISVMLIFLFVFTSYASLSASDGSAFVTKSEFDSALSDFNSRLTTFEAGINSKIDSQVTSYLDRNGIWSSKKQDLYTEKSSWVGLLGPTTKGTAKTFHYRESDGSGVAYFANYNEYGYPMSVGATDKRNKIVDKCSKNGLCYMVFQTESYITKNGTTSWPADTLVAEKSEGPVRFSFSYEGQWACWDVGFRVSFIWNVRQQDESGVDGEVLNSFSVTYPITLAGANLKNQALDKYVCLFFVKKCQPLLLDSKCLYEQYDGSSNKCKLVAMDSGAILAHRLYCTECDIY